MIGTNGRRLTPEAFKLLEEETEIERAMGDRKKAVALEMLLNWYREAADIIEEQVLIVLPTQDQADALRLSPTGTVRACGAGAMIGGRCFDRIVVITPVPRGETQVKELKDWIDSCIRTKLSGPSAKMLVISLDREQSELTPD